MGTPVKTAPIEGKQPSKFDGLLLDALDLPPVSPEPVWSESILIGVRNEHGDTYRAIGVAGMDYFVDIMEALRLLGFRHASINANEAEQGFDAVVCGPDS